MRLVGLSKVLRATYPSTPQRVQVTPADTAADDLDIDIGFLPRLGLEFLPDHVAIGRGVVQANPAFELVVGHRTSILRFRTWYSDWQLSYSEVQRDSQGVLGILYTPKTGQKRR